MPQASCTYHHCLKGYLDEQSLTTRTNNSFFSVVLNPPPDGSDSPQSKCQQDPFSKDDSPPDQGPFEDESAIREHHRKYHEDIERSHILNDFVAIRVKRDYFKDMRFVCLCGWDYNCSDSLFSHVKGWKGKPCSRVQEAGQVVATSKASYFNESRSFILYYKETPVRRESRPYLSSSTAKRKRKTPQVYS